MKSLLLRKTKSEFSVNTNEKDVIDNKTSLKTDKTFFSDKTMTQNKITLATGEEKVAKTLNTFFTEIVLNKKFPEYKRLSAL